MEEELQLSFDEKLPSPKGFGKDAILIYDRFFDKTKYKKWIDQFPAGYGVVAGEKLKDVKNFPGHIQKIVEKTAHFSTRNLTVVVLGGGSVGDFGGFVASVLKRGVRLVHIPSTWLAAIDSAHGGKTALNVGGYKNQIGTFYPAHQIFLVKEILFNQPLSRAHESYSELIKISLLQGGDLWERVSQLGAPSAEGIWSVLGGAIEAKYGVVAQDPEEKSGYRQILNLGHTVGHVFESTHGFPHGIAVNLGLHFALTWSVRQGYMTIETYQSILATPTGEWLINPVNEGLLQKKYFAFYEKALMQDKKKTAGQTLRFIFLQNPGEPLIEALKVTEIMREMIRQGKA